MESRAVTVAYGDGFGPQVLEAVLEILREAGANITVETIEIGSRIYSMESNTGILPSSWKTLEKNRILLKAPVRIPEGDDYKETGAVIRERMGLEKEQLHSFIESFNNTPTAHGYINERFALFEPLYEDGTYDKKPVTVDPSPMLHATLMMLIHIGDGHTASLIHNAWLVAMEDGCHRKERNRLPRMTDAIIERLGKLPKTVKPSEFKAQSAPELATSQQIHSVV